jgi:hypothetical protein
MVSGRNSIVPNERILNNKEVIKMIRKNFLLPAAPTAKPFDYNPDTRRGAVHGDGTG